jgi:hypothetical protein
MNHMRRRPIAVLLAVLAALAAVAPAAAWSNGPAKDGVTGNGYGTHDWIIDQALKTFGGKVPAWFEANTARLASDDPDTLFWKTNEHVYMGPTTAVPWPYGRGAVHQAVEYYAKAINHLKAGDAHNASIDIGRLTHFYADMLQPFHTNYAALGKDGPHAKYELLVDAANRTSTSAPEWQTADRSPEDVPDIRAKAIAAAAYSRAKYSELYAEFIKNQSVLNTRVKQITGYLMTRASRDIGDIINSIDKKIGNAPAIAKISISRKYSQPSSIEYQAIYIKVTDAAGKPLEGVKVDVTFPSSADVPNGAEPTAHIFRAYTMPDGIAKATAYIDLSMHGTKLTVKVAATSGGKTVSGTTWYQAK